MTRAKQQPESHFCQCTEGGAFRHGICLRCGKSFPCGNCGRALSTHYEDGMHLGCELSAHRTIYESDVNPGPLPYWLRVLLWGAAVVFCLFALKGVFRAFEWLWATFAGRI